MFTKLLVLILALGITASALLVYRQKRIDTANDLLRTHQRLVDHEQSLWDLRRDIAARCHPQELRDAMERLGEDWAPLPAVPEIPAFPSMNVAHDEQRPFDDNTQRGG